MKARKPRRPSKACGSGSRRREKEGRARQAREQDGALAGVPVALPALTRALKLQDKASKVGFDWNDPRAVLRKIREEADEIEAALDGDAEQKRPREVGDLLFAAVNLARHLRADPEAVLRQTNQKFERRFAAIEQRAGGARQDAAGRHARRNGCAVGRSEGARMRLSRAPGCMADFSRAPRIDALIPLREILPIHKPLRRRNGGLIAPPSLMKAMTGEALEVDFAARRAARRDRDRGKARASRARYSRDAPVSATMALPYRRVAPDRE